MASFNLIIRSPEKEVFSGEVEALTFDSEVGRIQILSHHMDYGTSFSFSTLRVNVENSVTFYSARRGLVTFDHERNEARVLCLYCEEQSQVNYQSAEEYLNFLRDQLATGHLSDYEVLYIEGEKLAVEKQVKTKKA
jgi:F0F1-type ATP synthase epsilon subunit